MGATISNLIIGQYVMIPMTVILGVLAAFVAWARFGQYAVDPRGMMQYADR